MNRAYIAEVGLFRYFLRTLLRQFAKRVLRRGLQFRLPTGLLMHLPRNSAFGSEVFVTGAQVDHGAESLFVSSLDADGDVIDAGANIGYYSMYVAPCARRVWAFEPDPRVLPDLALNAARVSNIEVVDRALFSSPGTMFLDTSGPSEVNTLVDGAPSDPELIRVKIESIDHFVAENPETKITGIKIDVEGKDMAVLTGARATIVRDQPIVLMEFNVGEGSTNNENDLLRFAADLSYALYGFIRLSDDATSRYTLRRLGHGGDPVGRCKMIFLVPGRLQPSFAARIS